MGPPHKIPDSDIQALKAAIWTHKVVAVKSQKDLSPIEQWELKSGDVWGIPGAENRWHIDAPLYEKDPAWFTTLRRIKPPPGPRFTIHWNDGTRQTMEGDPGLTAFFSNEHTYDLAILVGGIVPWVPQRSGCRVPGPGEALEELGDWDPKEVKKYPMVWVNPVTRERAFIVHEICARKLFLESSPDEEPRVVDDVVEIRKWLKGIQERVLKPEYIMITGLEEGDIVRARTMHQANIGGPVRFRFRHRTGNGI
ncbi:Alpha-ketoglutarate dependent xanthine dioxygenase [Zalerion maritima]|uniref:Alpha-ketoglutarate dependent xanthine dioxygenase n=1 Tax=Zalerion maritima TaxID=339359 RepID=A0AAD5WQF7_9PEZI|nr:Alpha-ketoglutarate dependent xanthine dioxygenase [Zalerion maritima]